MSEMNRLLVVLVAPLIVGCYSSGSISTGDIRKLQGRHKGDIIISSGKGKKPVRFGPRSKIRFFLKGSRPSAWFRGEDLRVNRVGVCVVKGCIPPKNGWRWEQIISANVSNLSGSRTHLALVLTVTGVTLAYVLIFRTLGRIDKRLAFPKVSKIMPSNRPRSGGVLPGDGPVPVEARQWDGAERILPRRNSPRPDPVPRPVLTDRAAGLPPPERDPDARKTSGGKVAKEPAGVVSTPPRLSLRATPGETSSLFRRRTRRRGKIRFIGMLEGGGDLLLTDGGNIQGLVGIRLFRMLDLAAGAHLMIHRGESQTEDHRASWIGVFRLNTHLALDPRRRVALPLGMDFGVGHATFYARLNFGVRVRLTRHLSVGLYPFNPTYAEFKDTTLKRRIGWWSFPTTIDLSFAL